MRDFKQGILWGYYYGGNLAYGWKEYGTYLAMSTTDARYRKFSIPELKAVFLPQAGLSE